MPQTSAVEPERARELLDQAEGVLAASLDLDATLRRVATLAVPELADWCAVDVVEGPDATRQITSGHPDPDQEALLIELRRRFRAQTEGREGVLSVIARREPELVTDVGDEPSGGLELTPDEQRHYARLAPRSYIILPLIARGRTIGALTLLSTTPGRHYTEGDLVWAERLTDRCALAVDNARLYAAAEQRFALLDTVFATAPVGLGLLDTELRFLLVNERLAAMNGLPAADHVGRTPALSGPQGAERERLYRRVLETGEPLLGHEMEGLGGDWWLVSGTPVPGADGRPLGLLETVLDISSRRRSALLARASDALETSLDFEATVQSAAAVAVPEFCDWCVVHLLEQDGGVRQVAVCHADAERRKWAWEVAERYPIDPAEERGVPEVIRTGRPDVTNDIPPELVIAGARDAEHARILAELGLRSAAIVPLRARDRTFGAMTFLSAESGRRFEPEDVELAVELGRRAALAVDNARLYTARADIAHTLQSRLLPSRLPDIPGIRVNARYRAAGEFNEVGGDFYDVMRCPAPDRRDDDWIAVVGDVTGKGAGAAAVTALARHTLRAAALHTTSPGAMLRLLNDAMRVEDDDGQLCTVCLARLRVEDDGIAVLVALGGHDPALILRADGRVEPAGRYGSLLGLMADPEFEDVAVRLDAGDLLLLYTDGMTDAGAPQRPVGPAGLRRMLAELAGRGPDEVLLELERAATAAGDGEPRDDIALLALQVAGLPSGRSGKRN